MFIAAYTLIFLLCMVGNTLVCFIVLKNRHMRTVTNMFILNLAVSDLLVGIFCMPTTLVDNLITGEYDQRAGGRPSPFAFIFRLKAEVEAEKRRSLSLSAKGSLSQYRPNGLISFFVPGMMGCMICALS